MEHLIKLDRLISLKIMIPMLLFKQMRMLKSIRRLLRQMVVWLMSMFRRERPTTQLKKVRTQKLFQFLMKLYKTPLLLQK